MTEYKSTVKIFKNNDGIQVKINSSWRSPPTLASSSYMTEQFDWLRMATGEEDEDILYA